VAQDDGIQFDSLIADILEGRRDIPIEARNKLMFTMVARVYQQQREINKRIKRVEDYSIGLWVEAHPFGALVISLFALSMLLILSSPDLREPFTQAWTTSKDLMP
jgi:hypothetical protein